MSIDYAERVQIKLFANENPPAAQHLIPVFHSWIQNKTLDELVIDVADYSHVYQGPGVVLIGHAVDYYYDESEGKPGLLFSRKRDFKGDFKSLLYDAFSQTFKACLLLEQEKGINLSFATDELLVRVVDRLHIDNREESFERLETLVKEIARENYQTEVFTQRVEDKKGPLSIRVRFDQPNALSTLVSNAANV